MINDINEPTRFDLWVDEKIKHTRIEGALTFVDDTFESVSSTPYINNGKRVQPSRSYIDDIPSYENFVHLLISELFYASTRTKEKYLEARDHQLGLRSEIDGQGRNIQTSIDEIRSFINRHKPITGRVFMRAAQRLKSEYRVSIDSCGVDLSLPKDRPSNKIKSINSSHHAIDKIMLCFLDELKNIKDFHHNSYIIEGVFFPKRIKRMLANPHLDILFFRLAMIIKDWKLGGKYIVSQISENKPIYLPAGNSHPQVIACLTNAFLSISPIIEPKDVSERLKELNKLEAYLAPPSVDLSF